MSETKNLKLFKHDEPLETNENQFNIKKALHDNWDKLDEFGGKVNTKTVEIENKQKQHDTDISNIKQEQQEQNLKIESNTTESKDNTELLNQIMGLLPSTKGEGENVTLDDTAEARFKNFQVQGNSKQETRSGKNAIKSLNRRAKRYISWVLDKSKLEKTMYFSLIASKDLNSTNSIFFNAIDGSLTAINKYAMAIKANVKSIRQIDFTEEELNTLKNSDKDIILQIYENNAEIDCTTITFSEVMLANSNNTDYEKYGASPSPEFPSKIRNVGDNVNLFNGNLSQGYDNNGSIKTSNQFVCNTDLISVRSGEKYTISNNLNKYIVSASYYKDNKFVSFVSNINLKTIEIPNNVNQIRFNLYDNKQLLVSQISILKFEEGTQVTPYSNHNCGNVAVEVYNRNFFDYKKVNNLAMTTPTIAENPKYRGYSLKVSPGEQYTISRKNIDNNNRFRISFTKEQPSNNVVLFGSEGEQGGYIEASHLTAITVTVPKKAKYLFLYLSNENENITEELQIQIEKGSTRSKYVQHQQQTILFPFTEGQRLCKGDYLAEDGIHHVRKQAELTETSGWSMGPLNAYRVPIQVFVGDVNRIIDGDKSIGLLSDRFVPKDSSEHTIGDEELYSFRRASGGLYLWFFMPKSFFTATTPEEILAEWKTYLKAQKEAGTPVVIEYELANEVVELYTPEQQEAYNKLKKLYSYNEQTNVFSKNEISPIFNVEAIKNLNVSVLQQTTKES